MSDLDQPIEEGLLDEDEAEALASALEDDPLAQQIPLPIIPYLLGVSGLYRWSRPLRPHPVSRPIPAPIPIEPHPIPRPIPGPGAEMGGETESGEAEEEAAFPIFFETEELRLDVDGRYPQMTASGTVRRGFFSRVHWIARLVRRGPSTWSGRIWYKDGATASFPYTAVWITAVRSFFRHQRRATVVFAGGGAPQRRRTYRYVSPYFRDVEFEYDHEQGLDPDLEIDTCAHPVRPASLPCEKLTIERVFSRAGFRARRSAGVSEIPTDGPDPNTTWSDAEMHDAMQRYWSRFANRPQWALWVLVAKQHDRGTNLGGIMFDDIGPNHRQGTAVFYDSFISNPPAGDPAPAAWTKRMRLWTKVHEMGHAFNLAHSWQKHLGTPWIPLLSEPEARSFMNYPYGVSGGQSSFFSDFEYRFSDGELLFMRHAPQRFVQMGNADWFDHHGFEGAAVEGETAFELEIGVDRDRPDFEFLEPVVLEIKVTNVSGQPRILSSDLLQQYGSMVVILKKEGKPARRWAPYATYCRQADTMVLQPGDWTTDSLFVSAGLNGWDLSEPGFYHVQVAMEIDGSDVISNALRLRVAPPSSREEERVAQDVFTEDAGRVMAFDGSKVMDEGNNAWQQVVDKLPESKAAVHARLCLALPLTQDYRTLRIDAPAGAMALDGRGAFEVSKSQDEMGQEELNKALMEAPAVAAETLGVVDYEYYCERFAGWLKATNRGKEAKKVDDAMRKEVARLAAHYPAPRVAAE